MKKNKIKMFIKFLIVMLITYSIIILIILVGFNIFNNIKNNKILDIIKTEIAETKRQGRYNELIEDLKEEKIINDTDDTHEENIFDMESTEIKGKIGKLLYEKERENKTFFRIGTIDIQIRVLNNNISKRIFEKSPIYYKNGDILAYALYTEESDTIEAVEGAKPHYYEYKKKVILRNGKIMYLGDRWLK